MKIPKPVQSTVLVDEDDATWNDDVIEDVNAKADPDLVVYSRDWTIETIVNQIEQENIDLNPKSTGSLCSLRACEDRRGDE